MLQSDGMPTNKDNELLSLLRVNAREPVSSLARKLGVSRSTVNDRLRKLERDGTITGYLVKLGADAQAGGFTAMISLGVEPRRQIDVGKSLSHFSEIETLYAVSGKVDFIARARTVSAEAMDGLIDRVATIPGVTDLETAVILSTKLDRR
jgi:DNA-binding Lrp family transcriptional regulator